MAMRRSTRNTPTVARGGEGPESVLLPGEVFGFEDSQTQAQVSDEDLNIRYSKGDIRIVSESARYPLAGILAMLEEEVDAGAAKTREKRYKLDPEYQRRHRWNNQRKSRLIESFLMNIPVPPVFLYEYDLARFEVMDGRQRLTALAEYYADEFRLEGLQFWPELHGRLYSQLPSKVRDGIDRRYISSIILLKETAADENKAALLKKLVFERLNSGGVKLSPQETRNAVYGGPLNTLCLRLSGNAHFRQMWGIPPQVEETATEDDNGEADSNDLDPPPATPQGVRMFEKMEDVELILRFFAYRHIQKSNAGLNRISSFLDEFLKKGNRYSEQILGAYEKLFVRTVDFLFDSLSTDAFSVITRRSRNSRATKIVYDPIMFVASAPDVTAAMQSIVARRDVLRDALIEMYAADQSSEKLFSGRRTNNADIHGRNRLMRATFDDVLKRI